MASKNAASVLSGKDAKYDNNPAASEFFSTLMAAATYAQILHRQTVGEGSDARHRALGDLYDGLIDLSDNVVEQYQGCKEALVAYQLASYKEPADAVAFVRELHDYIEATRYKVCEETYIQNSIDEILSLLVRVKFRLMFLR